MSCADSSGNSASTEVVGYGRDGHRKWTWHGGVGELEMWPRSVASGPVLADTAPVSLDPSDTEGQRVTQTVTALDPATGRPLWKQPLPQSWAGDFFSSGGAPGLLMAGTVPFLADKEETSGNLTLAALDPMPGS